MKKLWVKWAQSTNFCDIPVNNNWQGEVRLDTEDVPTLAPLVEPSKPGTINISRSFSGSDGVVISDEEDSESEAESTGSSGEDKLETSMKQLDIKNVGCSRQYLDMGMGVVGVIFNKYLIFEFCTENNSLLLGI